MKKVLIVADLFHSSPRIPGISLNMLKFGWEPTIITRPIKDDPKNLLAFPKGFLEKVRIIETDYDGDVFIFWRNLLVRLGFKNKKSILNQVKEKTGAKSKKTFIDFIFKLYLTFFAYPDIEKKWENQAIKAAVYIMEKEKFRMILSSSSPVTCHVICSKLKKKFKVPWVADFRDLWTQNHDYNYFWPRKIFEKKLEIEILKEADALVTVSDPFKTNLSKLHIGKPVYAITNGFNLEEMNNSSADLTDKFTITYAGNIYIGKQDPKDLFIALKDFISENLVDPEDIEIRFFTGAIPWLEKEISDYEFEKFAKVYEKKSRNEIFEKQNESQLLLVIYWADKKERGWQSLKIFGYLASQRPILVINGSGDDVVKEMIEKTKSGTYCEDINDLKKSLKVFYDDYKKNGKVTYEGNMEEIKKHSYLEKAKKFAVIFDKIAV